MEKQMRHKDFLEMIPFYLYDELKPNEILSFRNHLETCSECTKEFEIYKSLFNKISVDAKIEVDTDLLTASRRELREVLLSQRSHITLSQRIIENILAVLVRPVGFALSGVSVFIVGLFIGFLIFNTPAPIGIVQSADDQNINIASHANIKVSNIKFIDSDPSDGEVEFTYDIVKQGHLKESVSNPDVQNILTYALLNEQNPGTRLNSLNVINANQTQQSDEEIKSSLITVAKYDDNPGVRREAVKSLKEFSADEDIKNTLIYVLLNDTSSGIRIEAINGLVDVSKRGINLNQKDLTLLRGKIQTDNNKYVRFQAKNIIKEY
jgi:hypothetical protein